jgi:hypothetical protein
VLPSTLDSLTQLKKEGYRLGVIDDPLEILTRGYLDMKASCKKGRGLQDVLGDSCFWEEMSVILGGFKSSDFRSSVSETLASPKTASYGWSGEIALLLEKAPWVEYVLPSQSLVVGADFVCISQKSKIKQSAIRFVEILTDKESSRWSVEFSQYFSPYKKPPKGLKKKTRKLLDDLLGRLEKEAPVVLTPPDKAGQKKINTFWRKIRYGN